MIDKKDSPKKGVEEGPLGGNRIDQSRSGASVDESTLTEGERRRGGQHS